MSYYSVKNPSNFSVTDPQTQVKDSIEYLFKPFQKRMLLQNLSVNEDTYGNNTNPSEFAQSFTQIVWATGAVGCSASNPYILSGDNFVYETVFRLLADTRRNYNGAGSTGAIRNFFFAIDPVLNDVQYEIQNLWLPFKNLYGVQNIPIGTSIGPKFEMSYNSQMIKLIGTGPNWDTVLVTQNPFNSAMTPIPSSMVYTNTSQLGLSSGLPLSTTTPYYISPVDKGSCGGNIFYYSQDNDMYWASNYPASYKALPGFCTELK